MAIGDEIKIKMCLKECGDHLYPDGECKDKCKGSYLFYNYESGTCLEQFPYFYVIYGEDEEEKEKIKVSSNVQALIHIM